MVTPAGALVRAGSVTAGLIAVHTAVNLALLRSPDRSAPEVTEDVTVCIPARNEARHIAATVRSVLAQTSVPRLTVLVLDDGSEDGTAEIVAELARSDDRVRLISGPDADPPPGWLGKPWACARLADEANGAVLVFVDADVVLHPEAIRSCVHLLREHGFAMVAPYPRQLAGSWLERLVQPLVTWSWAATMPVRWAENSTRPSLSAANGQLLVLDSATYRGIGGHAAVRGEVLEDIALMRAFKVARQRTSTVDGTEVAECRMYDGPEQVVDGYAKSLWSAFGGPTGSVGALALLTTAFVLPAVAAVTARDRSTRRWGAAGYAAGVASRLMVARRTGQPAVDCLAHPASVAAFVALNVVSWSRHRRGDNTWKGRAVTPSDHGRMSRGGRA